MIEMSQTQIPTRAMQEKQIRDIQQQMLMQRQQIEQALQASALCRQAVSARGDTAGRQEAQRALDAGQNAINTIIEKPNTEQVFRFLKDNRAKAFTLDIETDSDHHDRRERREGTPRRVHRRADARCCSKIGQMVTATPESAEFCGELLKFAVAPFRAGRVARLARSIS